MEKYMIHTNTDDMTGNIILYKQRPGFIDWAIATATKGPYTHCELIIDKDRNTIGAFSDGIKYSKVPTDKTSYIRISLLTADPYGNQAIWEKNITKGVEWAIAQVGRAYGWLDIVDQAVDFLLPGNTIRLVDDAHWDCSDFLVHYLRHIGYILPQTMMTGAAVSPNDLARMFKILT
jgi:hypothetical protein